MIRRIYAFFMLAVLFGFAGCTDLQLAKNGTTKYVIVKPEKPSEVDDYAVKELAAFLKEKTGTEFPVVSPDQAPPNKKYIFIGLSDPVKKTIGQDPLAPLKDQEYVVRNIGNNIFLYGKGLHGNFHAAADLMENTLGRRWFHCKKYYSWRETNNFDKAVFSVERNLSVKPFDRKEGFSFTYRSLSEGSVNPFEYYHGINMGHGVSAGIVPLKVFQLYVHTSFYYIPPKPISPPSMAKRFELTANKEYFKTNPDFFTMDESGQRVADRQLCFSNPDLRKELTKNIKEHIKRVGENVIVALSRDKCVGDNLIIAMDQNDNCGAFCCCPGCKELEKKYQSPGGPMYDYLIELCSMLKTEYPNIMIKTLAYRRSQTQKPPVLPEGKKFPDNLIVEFANVEDKLDADWNSPVNHSTYEDLLAWSKLTSHLWTWYYPNQYGPVSFMPFGYIERLVNDIRMMKKAGCEGVFYEFSTSQVRTGDGFTELQMYLACKLTKDVNSDVLALIKEFTDYQYGSAAPLVIKYLNELEEGRKILKVHVNLIWNQIDDVSACLSVENILSWQKYFDQMEKDTAADPRCLKNVKRLRRLLEFATLVRWNELSKKYPDYFNDYLVHKERLGKLDKSEEAMVADCEVIINAGGKIKPLPPQFDGIDQNSIRQFIPTNKSKSLEPKVILDPDAAFGYAATIAKPDMPFNFGLMAGIRRKLESPDIKPGVFQLYKLGMITVKPPGSPNNSIWFSMKSFYTSLELGDRLYEPGEQNLWETYVSLKFDGPSYGGNAKEDQVLCDRIIFVRKEAKQ